MTSTKNTVKNYIMYYKDKLDRCNDDEDLLLETINKLQKPAVNAEVIQETGVLKHLQKLCRRKGPVADIAMPLYQKWKLLLSIAMHERCKKPSQAEERPNVPAPTKPHMREVDPSARSSHPVTDKDPASHLTHRIRDSHPDRGIKRKDPLPHASDLKRLTHHSYRDPKHQTLPQKDNDTKTLTQKDHPPPDTKTTHRSSDSDSDRGSKHHPSSAKKDYFASEANSMHGNPRNPKKDLISLEASSQRDFKPRKELLVRDVDRSESSSITLSNLSLFSRDSDFKSRKELLASDMDSTLTGSLAHQSRDGSAHAGNLSQYCRGSNYKSQKELFAPDVESTRGDSLSQYSRDSGPKFPPPVQRDALLLEVDGYSAGGSNRNSDSRYPSAKKDYFAAEADSTCPGSRSPEHNGISNSQDSNHIDIDSLSNPNLCIDATPKLNTSDDSDHATPTKRAKTLEPYYIEMREGMFRAVKNHNTKPFWNSGICEILRGEIKGNSSYKRERERFEEQKRNDSTFSFSMSPREASSDGEKWNTKNGPTEPKPSSDWSGRASSANPLKTDLKRKSASPCKGSDKKARPDSTSDHKLKIKKDIHSPSHLSKSLNNMEAHQSNCDKNKKLPDSPETSAMQYMSSKKDRRAVYSGRKSALDISSLKSNCLRVLRKNLDYLRCPMNVPYDTLHPILETLNPSQLSKIEEHNRYLLISTNSLWKQHYQRDHRSQVVGKSEKDIVWKDEYNRAKELQRKKLKNLTASINAAASKAKPDRQAKVVDSHQNFGRRGTRTPEVPVTSSKCAVPASGATTKCAVPASSSRSSSSPKASSSVPKPVAPIISKPKEVKHASNLKPVKKVVAPLMSKVKKSMQIVYRQK